jgi:YegS/Rv2252/BmrU family lipid kinase
MVAKAEARLRRLGHTVESLFTSKRGDARAFAGRAHDFGCVVAVGGDGTINEVLNGMPDGGPPVAQIPVGTANVLAKTFGLPRGAVAAADLIHRGTTTEVDLGLANGRKFILMASAGFDAQVVHDFHAARKGTIRMTDYVLWGLRSVLKYDSPCLRVAADGRPLPDGAFAIASNLPCYGGPLAFTRGALTDDGLLDLLVFHAVGKLNTVRLFAEAFAGDPCAMPDATHVRAKRIRIEADTPLPWQVDGEPGDVLPLEIGVVPKAVKLVVPLD